MEHAQLVIEITQNIKMVLNGPPLNTDSALLVMSHRDIFVIGYYYPYNMSSQNMITGGFNGAF